VAEPVAATLARLTAGNPLALAELAGLLDGEQLSGQAWLPDALPVGAGVERAFLTRVRALPEAARTMLLVAAGAGGGARRRGVPRGLADVLTGEADADRRAWPRAAATPTVDDAVADELEAC